MLSGPLVDDGDEGTMWEPYKGEISPAEAAGVKQAMTKREVTRILGEPAETRESKGELDPEEYLYYDLKEGRPTSWQFVFRDG